MRKKFVAGNWKMFTTAATARELAAAVGKGLGAEDRVNVAVAPPFPYLARVSWPKDGPATFLVLSREQNQSRDQDPVTRQSLAPPTC